MLDILAPVLMNVIPRSVIEDSFSLSTLIVELVIAAIMMVCLFLCRQRTMKIICLCGAEICLWLACKMAFGEDAILTQIMTWLTALVAIVIVITIVNHIDWSNLRGRRQ